MVRPAAFAYTRPDQLTSALRSLEDGGRVLAGGQGLLQALKLRADTADHLVDVKGLGELRGIDDGADGGLRIGALTTISELTVDERVSARVPGFAEAAKLLGDQQVRNRATVGGALCLADPRGNLAPMLIALGATVVVRSSSDEREIPVETLFAGFRRTTLSADELVTELRVPGWASISAYLEIARQPQGPPIVNVGVALAGDPVERAGVAAGGIHQTPIRLDDVERSILGRVVDEGSCREAAAALDATSLEPVSDLHASAQYRLSVVRVLIRRALLAEGGTATRRVQA
ncbi:xanthine dehydrogenase family protein subunit M [Egibacter rhizosphaerae]|uniref:Xanthine dehydrogenase family protein subunit M n=1 Tax=Egibacter rhizosphaerae TaxID=1670831 RepID=A0A411YBE4_9ACTN|nr:xanthine dehydrogenase family protein subunit M [Egibacter rhizosphaerae]QBI18524.1 xanthine dehydrogenase family protein subunit M [Egibacter rhizosphaerae]